MTAKHIAIVGAGPKAAAIAAKADILNRTQKSELRVTIFEQTRAGANWAGEDGYTDGEARLCTPAERDFGFPYDAGVFDPKIASAMYDEYSWGAYLLQRARADARLGFNDWVNRGRLPPTHAEFASYVDWAIGKSHAKLEFERVIRVEAMEGGWRLHRRTQSAGTRSQGMFDGVVFTGPGPPLNRVERVGASSRIADGRDFWRDPDAFLELARECEEPVIILGAGGTAAAIAARAVRAKSPREVLIVGDQAALFTRAEAFFESQIFSDEDIWDRLNPDVRREFTDRLNRGVVWATMSGELSKSRKIRFEPGRGRRITVRTGVEGEEVVVRCVRGSYEWEIPASLVIDASGFDSWWFVPLLPTRLQTKALAKTEKAQIKKRRKLADDMNENLALFSEPPGPIHVPMLSQAVGPGFSSLMVLGAMSDRILDHYLTDCITP